MILGLHAVLPTEVHERPTDLLESWMVLGWFEGEDDKDGDEGGDGPMCPSIASFSSATSLK